MAFQPTKAFDGFEDAGRDPPHNHLPSAPAFHVPLHVPRATDDALDRVRRGERVSKALPRQKPGAQVHLLTTCLPPSLADLLTRRVDYCREATLGRRASFGLFSARVSSSVEMSV